MDMLIIEPRGMPPQGDENGKNIRAPSNATQRINCRRLIEKLGKLLENDDRYFNEMDSGSPRTSLGRGHHTSPFTNRINGSPKLSIHPRPTNRQPGTTVPVTQH